MLGHHILKSKIPFISKILDYFNKEINLNYKYFPFGSIIKIFLRSILYIFLVTYILYNIMIYVNPFPDINENPLVSSRSGAEIDFIKDQPDILGKYYLFFTKAINKDFGLSEETRSPIYDDIIYAFTNTLLLIFCSLFISFIISILMVLLSFNKITKAVIVRMLSYLSYFHISFIILLVTKKIFIINFSEYSYFLLLLLASILSSFGNGILVDYYQLINQEYKNIMNKDYVLFAKDSGFKFFLFARKELLFNLVNITISRIPIIFGGLIIIEYFFKDTALGGISTLIFEYNGFQDYNATFASIVVCTVFFSIFYFTSEYLQKEIIKND